MTVDETLHAVNLVALVQALGRRESSATVVLSQHRRQGAIVLSEGRIVHATAGSTTGDEALLEVLAWTTGEIELTSLSQAPAATVDQGLAALVLSGAVRTAYGQQR